jgi:hypothetical protein
MSATDASGPRAAVGEVVRPHGRAKYNAEHCPCAVCRRANADYEKRRVRQRAYGRVAYVDAEPARVHVHALRAGGLGSRRIAALAGVPHGSVSKLIYGDPRRGLAPSKRVRSATAEKLLAVQLVLEHIGDGQRIDATGTRRRLQALMATGWSRAKLAARLGVTATNLASTMASERVFASTARAVRALYERLWNALPSEEHHRDRISASRARSYARASGWLPPMAWDDDRIDDPDFTPELDAVTDEVDPVAVEQACAGLRVARSLRPAELTAAVRQLAGSQMSVNAIVTRLHSSDAVVRARLDDQVTPRPPETSSRCRTLRCAGSAPIATDTEEDIA